ncbi:MAG: hypothetical protein L0H73_13640 [Nitrococcus sp.]|nr:hypothetical protein [Nitrococcus sp.]
MPPTDTIHRTEQLAWRIGEYAEAARISRSKLYARLKAGTGPHVTYLDGVPLILRADGIAWLERQRDAGEPNKSHDLETGRAGGAHERA